MLNKIIILLIFSLGVNFTLFSQNISYNHIVDSSDIETKKVIRLFEDYIKSEPQKQTRNSFWNSQDQNLYTRYDFLEDEFKPSLYMGFPIHILSIKFINGVYKIKAQFSYCQENGSLYVLAIVNYIIKKENENYKLYNALTFNKADWNCTNIGFVDFYYPKYHKLNIEKAKKLNDFIENICLNLNVTPKYFEYYLADDYDEIQALKGIDYYIGMGGKSKPSGKASNNKVYCGGLGEYYPHEVFHIQIDQHYPNKHYWVTEGLATFVANSSRGKELKWHYKRLHNYLIEHPDVNLNQLINFVNFDEHTDYHYVLGGLIADRIYKKGGWKLIIEYMNSGDSDKDYYKSIENLLGIKQNELNLYLREQLSIESKYK